MDFRKQREELNLSQEALGKLAGYDKATISQLETQDLGSPRLRRDVAKALETRRGQIEGLLKESHSALAELEGIRSTLKLLEPSVIESLVAMPAAKLLEFPEPERQKVMAVLAEARTLIEERKHPPKPSDAEIIGVAREAAQEPVMGYPRPHPVPGGARRKYRRRDRPK